MYENVWLGSPKLSVMESLAPGTRKGAGAASSPRVHQRVKTPRRAHCQDSPTPTPTRREAKSTGR